MSRFQRTNGTGAPGAARRRVVRCHRQGHLRSRFRRWRPPGGRSVRLARRCSNGSAPRFSIAPPPKSSPKRCCRRWRDCVAVADVPDPGVPDSPAARRSRRPHHRMDAARPQSSAATASPCSKPTTWTMRKRNDNRLRNMARAVEQSPISVVITDVQGRHRIRQPALHPDHRLWLRRSHRHDPGDRPNRDSPRRSNTASFGRP